MKALDGLVEVAGCRSHRGGTKGQLNFRRRQEEMDVAAGLAGRVAVVGYGLEGGAHSLAKRQ